MDYRYYKREHKRRSMGFILQTALILSIIAVILVGLIVLTIHSSNNLMDVEGKVVSNVPSNILPSYSTCSFESYDGQTNLSGWFFKCSDPISTVIVVHNVGDNRLQYGVDMVDMVERLLDSNYNVFLFDLRNSGDSEGDIVGYGYLEWQDVLGAISQVKKISVTTDVILFGFGTGVTASLLAYDMLPPINAAESELSNYDSDIVALGYDQGYIKGFIFDSPAKNSDDYIIPVVEQKEFLGNFTKRTVPYAIRISSGIDSSLNIAAEISRLSIPVCIIYGAHDTFVGADKINQLLTERMRISEHLTSSVMVPGAGYLESYTLDRELYIDTVINYLNKFFD
ncbi:MAG: hypothetical protein MJ153_05145 [Clostridia bacterium]|nr:hypothetical protein [Clostridia bacterium]